LDEVRTTNSYFEIQKDERSGAIVFANAGAAVVVAGDAIQCASPRFDWRSFAGHSFITVPLKVSWRNTRNMMNSCHQHYTLVLERKNAHKLLILVLSHIDKTSIASLFFQCFLAKVWDELCLIEWLALARQSSCFVIRYIWLSVLLRFDLFSLLDTKQYRCSPQISKLSNKLFYENKLIDAAEPGRIRVDLFVNEMLLLLIVAF
jgi:hypothetical protein